MPSEEPAAEIAFKVFDLNDGLLSLECAASFQNTVLRDHAGRLWFATQKGVATVNPASVRLNTNPPPVVIESAAYTDQTGNKIVLENPGTAAQTLLRSFEAVKSLHDLVRMYARERAESLLPAADRDEALRRLVDHYLHTLLRGQRLMDPRRPMITVPPARPDVVVTR